NYEIRTIQIIFAPESNKFSRKLKTSLQYHQNSLQTKFFRSIRANIRSTPKIFAPPPSSPHTTLSPTQAAYLSKIRTSITLAFSFKNTLPFLNRLHYLYILNFHRFYFQRIPIQYNKIS